MARLLVLLLLGADILYVNSFGTNIARFCKALIAPFVVVTGLSSSALAKDIPLYFGNGCFWHIQHEMVDAEQKILGRTEEELTSAAGYAGGTKEGRFDNMPGRKGVCYHNLQFVADYGSLGHSEVVGLTIPEEKIKEFAKVYFSTFVDNDRPDKMDRGKEYRSLIGLPGGIQGPNFMMIETVAKEQGIGLKLLEGKGDDSDTLGEKIVWVMDSTKFPFYQGEIYHQFHDGFMAGEQYPESYNTLAMKAYKEGRLKETGCPDIVSRADQPPQMSRVPPLYKNNIPDI